ncbi:MAG: bifunctional folylpolyglutamate synthase/dihydrofolate synthase [Crocinitomicaceae bacterium]|jgi:dihydrofolate synthase/folylpolyglutamate synthase|nr:bifunctional folylpolyglutamate synthase/dihydrofolate synthase [Crocinitomicaceae bacterium]
MLESNYQDTIDWLFAQFPSYQLMGSPAYKPGLENVQKLCDALGNPHHELKFVHVAGSNGKGSTACMLASFFTENKLKTGLFTSPHLVDFRERIRVNGEMIAEEEVVVFCERIKALKLDFDPSFFEISFTMSLVHFLNQNCDICVIETGLGGRLDATNIILPQISIITGISLEHTNFLGDTIEQIAEEKAGIIKEGVPVIVGNLQEKTSSVFEKRANLLLAPIHYADSYAIDFDQEFPLLGDYQKKNFKTACLASLIIGQTGYEFDFSKWSAALSNLNKNTGFQARLQVISATPRVIYDVSHNEEGIQHTLDFLKSEMKEGKLHIVYGSSADKDFDTIFPLFIKTDVYYFTEFTNERSTKKAVLEEHAQKNDLNYTSFEKAQVAMEAAQLAANPSDTILAFGSFFLLHDFLK